MSARGDEIAAAARTWLGTPYVHQASCKGAGADCLGLVRGLWREVVGPEPETPPPYTWDWSETGGEALLGAALRHLIPCRMGDPGPGDILLFRMRDGRVAKHLGIVSRAAPTLRFIHAYSGHGVVENSLSAPWRRRVAARFRYPERIR